MDDAEQQAEAIFQAANEYIKEALAPVQNRLLRQEKEAEALLRKIEALANSMDAFWMSIDGGPGTKSIKMRRTDGRLVTMTRTIE